MMGALVGSRCEPMSEQTLYVTWCTDCNNKTVHDSAVDAEKAVEGHEAARTHKAEWKQVKVGE